MTTSRSDRRVRRGGIVRIAGWLSAGAMLATAALAPASVAAANPTSMDVACNNIVNGGRSPEYVWTTVGAAGVTANWAIDAAHFDSANQETVTVRVCVVDADGADRGGIDQNTENDGVQLFPWSVLGYAADPCPNSSLTFGSSVDSAAVQTKKSNMIDCPAADQPTDGAGDQPTDDAGDQPTDDAGDQPTDNAGDQPTDNAGDPTDNAGDQPTDDAGDQPTDNAGDQPTDDAGDPTDNAPDQPSDSADAPTGAVKGIVGTPGLTPPPTDTQLVAPAAGGSDGWRMVIVLMAAVLIGSLAASQPRRARRRA
jgi:hypothetical protein